MTPRQPIIVPLYNQQDVLPQLSRRVLVAAARLQGSVEIIFVNDGSGDGTLAPLKALQFEDKVIRRVCSRVTSDTRRRSPLGLCHAEGDAVAVLDGDLQDPPELLPELLREARRWMGCRSTACDGTAATAIVKRLSYFVFYRLLHRLAAIEIPLDAGDFCAMSRRIVDELNRLPETDRFVRGLRAWVGFRQTGVPYERAGGRRGPEVHDRQAHRAVAGRPACRSPMRRSGGSPASASCCARSASSASS